MFGYVIVNKPELKIKDLIFIAVFTVVFVNV